MKSHKLFRLISLVLLSLISVPLFTNAYAEPVQFVKVRSGGKETSLIQKLVTVKAQTPIWPQEGGKGKVQYVSAYNIFFHAKASNGKEESAGYYRIADERGNHLGWVKTEDVVVWGTRFAISPIEPFDGNEFKVALDSSSGGGLAVYDGANIPQSAAAYAFILGSANQDRDGSEDDGPFPVCLCIAESNASGAEAELNQISNLQLEVVFVLEMTDFFISVYDDKSLMEWVKDLGREFVKVIEAPQTDNQSIPTRLGLVIYQDTNSNAKIKKPLIVQSLTDNIQEWFRKLDGLAPDEIGGDIPEDGYSGVWMALDNQMGWKKNSSKHIVLIGHGPLQESGRKVSWRPVKGTVGILEDRTHRLWEKDWDLFFGYNSSGMTTSDLHNRAYPQTGTIGDKLRETRNLHAVRAGEDSKTRVRRRMLENGESREKIDEVFTALDEISEIVKSANEQEQIELYLDKKVGGVVKLAHQFSVAGQYDQLALKQYGDLVKSGDNPGYFRSFSPKAEEVRQVIADLKSRIDSAIKVVAEVASGNAAGFKGAENSGNEFSKPIFKLVNSALKSEEVIEKPVQQGVASTRDSKSGRLVGHKMIMVSREELQRLGSSFNSLYEQFDRRRARAERQDVTRILEDLKASLAQATSGQSITDRTVLAELITDLPLRTSALMLSPGDIAVMASRDFESWLEDLQLAQRRVEQLLEGDKWIRISSLNSSTGQYAFLKVADLP